MTVESLAGEYGEDLEYISTKLQLAESQNKVEICSMCRLPLLACVCVCVCVFIFVCLCVCVCVCFIYKYVRVYVCHGVHTYTYMSV